MYQILITTTNIPHYKLVNTIKHYYLVAKLTIKQQTEHDNASTADLCSQLGLTLLSWIGTYARVVTVMNCVQLHECVTVLG